MRTLLLLAICSAIAGCHTANERPILGGNTNLPAIQPSGDVVPPASDLRKTTRIDHGDWATTTFLVPVDATVHGPTWNVGRIRAATGSPRRTGLYPTPQSAVELDHANTQLFEAFTAVPLALLDVAVLPLQAFSDPPWTMHQSPRGLYKRTFQADDWYAGPLPTTEEGSE